ncbi:MAG: TetR family transcriptional regulator [Deltaproteobacteria bacterium]|jgi:AcrR family transcriptional regulator|nr:TetR family transcriptional regulator [Deltaproteobacteria bacterium]MBW2498268.1 TetR family transcriptional regulator [Deltaproteobacteria bacterium]
MNKGSPTRQRILDASRQLFNSRGYAKTTLAEIAAEVGIAEGNLWYHFRTKRDLVIALEEQLRLAVRERRAAYPSGGPVADDYVESLLFAMSQKWAYRFLLRDHLQFSKDRKPLQLDPDMTADFEMIREALERMKKEGMFRRDLPIDLDVLARSLWIVSRYWTDYLQEQEGLNEIEWSDQQRGFQHHFAVLLPYVTAAARRSLESALLRISTELAVRATT